MTDAFGIRTARPGDLAALDALFARSYPRLLKSDYPPSVLVTVLPIISRAQPVLLASGTYFVAETDVGQIVGAGGWTVSRALHTAEIRHVVTDMDHVRNGVGRALLNHVFNTARGAGIGSLTCQSTRTAVPFYRAMGFAVIGPIEIVLRPGISFPVIRMLKSMGTTQ